MDDDKGDRQPNQAMGGDKARDPVEEPSGWEGGGESGGGARAQNADGAVDGSGSGGYFGHGGQSHIAYSGTGDDDGEHNENAGTGAD